MSWFVGLSKTSARNPAGPDKRSCHGTITVRFQVPKQQNIFPNPLLAIPSIETIYARYLGTFDPPPNYKLKEEIHILL